MDLSMPSEDETKRRAQLHLLILYVAMGLMVLGPVLAWFLLRKLSR